MNVSRPLLVVSAFLALIGLGLPWTSSLPGLSLAPLWVPGFCSTSYDYYGYATVDCSYGSFVYGGYVPGVPSAPGYATGVRVFVAVAAVLVLVGLRRASRRPVLAALLVAGTGWLLHAGSQPGQVVFALALAVLAAALFGHVRLPSAVPSPG